ncbi:MAG: peptidylprolyl isomerase [Planctomycetota bacterium]|jgi:parvulin-like peptidyl-prolyl isomerase
MAVYVNGEKIDEKHIQAQVEQLRPDYERTFADQPADEQQKQLYEWSRENVIEAVLLQQAARKNLGRVPSETVDKMYEQYVKQNGGKTDDEKKVKAEIAERMSVEGLISTITGDVKGPSEKEIRKFYDADIDRFTMPEMVRASHIVIHHDPNVEDEKVKEQMQDILEKLRNGADFGKVAGEHSNCPDNGGDLGYFPRGNMVVEFEDVVFSMEVGAVSEVFKTGFGYHIAKVTDKRPAMVCPLEDVREVIVRKLTEQYQQKALEKFIDAEKARATIEEK